MKKCKLSQFLAFTLLGDQLSVILNFAEIFDCFVLTKNLMTGARGGRTAGRALRSELLCFDGKFTRQILNFHLHI